MAKNPVLPLYYNDITTSTLDWTDEQFGAYMRLLIHQWRQGGLPNDYQRLTRIATSLATTWPLVKTKFEEVDGLLKNPYMEDVRIKKAKHSEKQSINVNKRYQNSTKQDTKNIPLEREIEIEKDIVLNNKETFEQRFDVAFDSLTVDTYKVNFPSLDVDAELRHFRLKCNNDKPNYHSRAPESLRTSFQYQLKNSRPSQKPKSRILHDLI